MAALAGSVFNDVDDATTHIDGITFMKNTGVSVGCDANNNYCPDDPVSRAQMATLMYRLSGNDPATPPSVNAATLGGFSADDFAKTGAGSPSDADTLDGLDSTDFLAATGKAADADLLDGMDSTDFLGATAQATDSDSVDGLDASSLVRVAFDQTVDAALTGSNGTAASAAITAPVDGFLVISASANTANSANTGDVFTCSIDVDGVPIPESVRQMEHDGNETPAVNREENCATDAVHTVTAGAYVVTLEFDSIVDPGTRVDEASLWVLFVPFDGTGA